MSTFTVFGIDGNIGSGKSRLYGTLQEKFKDNANIIFVPEPVKDWECIHNREGKTMVQLFYADQKRYAFAFQMMAFISRLSMLMRTIEENKDRNIIIITERTLYTDRYVFAKMLYDQGKIEDVEYQIYLRWFDEFVAKFPVDNVIYVKTDPEECHKRIHIRARQGEEIIPLSYLEECHRFHEAFLDKETGIKVNQLIIDGNVNVFLNPEADEKRLKQIEDFISPSELL